MQLLEQMCGTVDHVSISACSGDFDLLENNVNTAEFYKIHRLSCLIVRELVKKEEAEK